MTQLFSRNHSSFTYLNTTQFLGALNDNIFKFLIVFFCIEVQGIERSSVVLATAGAIFVIPFLLFSATSGTLADRFSKRNIIVSCKLFELIVMSLGVATFAFRSEHGAYAVLFLMATQSAIFGPSKYGIIPEIVREENITKANGLLTSFTFLAIIIGTFLASFLTDVTGRNFILAALFCVGISFIGAMTSYLIEETSPSGAKKKIHPWFFLEIYKAIKIANTKPSLLMAIFGSAYFLFAGAFIQLNVIPFALHSLHLTDVQGGYLFLLSALGIGTGAMLVGKLSGKSVELGLVPIAGLGMTIGSFLLDYFSENLFATIIDIYFLGLLGGVFLVPLDTYIQVTSPSKSRGQLVATANFFGFVGVLAASAVIYFLTEIIGFMPDKGFTFLGILNILMTITLTIATYDYFARYIAMVFSRIRFKISIQGSDQIPRHMPSLYICNHTAWNDTLLIMGTQRRRIRFFSDTEQEHSAWIKRLYRLLRIIMIPSVETIDADYRQQREVKKALEKGISVCIFVDTLKKENRISEVAQTFKEILEESPCPIIVTSITKKENQGSFTFLNPLKRFLKKLRSPANVSFTIFKPSL